MKRTSLRLTAFAMAAMMSVGVMLPAQVTNVYAEDLVEDVTKEDGVVIEHGSAYKASTSTAKSKTKTSGKSGGIKAPSANYTGLAKSGSKTYYFKNGKICTGFVKTDKGYMYFDPKTYVMKTGFVYSKGLYCFGSNGIMLTNGMYEIDNTYYYFGKDGRATTYPVAGKNTVLIPNVLKYDMTSAIGHMYKKYGKKNIPLAKREKLIDAETEARNGGVFCVQSDNAYCTEFKGDIISDMEALGYEVELYDVDNSSEQYTLYINGTYVGVMVFGYDHDNYWGQFAIMSGTK